MLSEIEPKQIHWNNNRMQVTFASVCLSMLQLITKQQTVNISPFQSLSTSYCKTTGCMWYFVKVNSSYKIIWQQRVSGMLSFYQFIMSIPFHKEVSNAGYSAVGQFEWLFCSQIVSYIAGFVNSSKFTSFPIHIGG